jgi:serine/threonine protein kinase
VFAEDYRVERLLSQGGQGSLYVVEQISTRRARALKLMRPELVGRPDLRRRFDTEARVGARIESDHVVDVIASGIEGETGTPWLVMELLEGEELGARVEAKGPLPPAEVREVFGQLCHALGAAHRVPIIHRDLKPENVLLSKPRRRNAPPLVKVIDFGVARMMAEVKTANRTQSMLGTPLWMAPEQVTPGAPITPAADVWSLGLLAFYALTGRSFWLAGEEADAGVWKILNEVCVLPIPSASARAAEQGRGDLLPAGFDAWFARCVDRDAAQRFPDAAGAYEALEPLLPEPAPRSSVVDAAAGPPSRSVEKVEAPPSVAAPMVTAAAAPARPRWAWVVIAVALLAAAALLALRARQP